MVVVLFQVFLAPYMQAAYRNWRMVSSRMLLGTASLKAAPQGLIRLMYVHLVEPVMSSVRQPVLVSQQR